MSRKKHPAIHIHWQVQHQACGQFEWYQEGIWKVFFFLFSSNRLYLIIITSVYHPTFLTPYNLPGTVPGSPRTKRKEDIALASKD